MRPQHLFSTAIIIMVLHAIPAGTASAGSTTPVPPELWNSKTPTPLPASLEKKVRDGLTLVELVKLLGPAWMSRFEGVGEIHWFFDDGRELDVMPDHENLGADKLTFKGNGHSRMAWERGVPIDEPQLDKAPIIITDGTEVGKPPK